MANPNVRICKARFSARALHRVEAIVRSCDFLSVHGRYYVCVRSNAMDNDIARKYFFLHLRHRVLTCASWSWGHLLVEDLTCRWYRHHAPNNVAHVVGYQQRAFAIDRDADWTSHCVTILSHEASQHVDRCA